MGLVWRKDDLLTLAEKQVNMANETCQQKIYAGIEVELSGGTEHFSLETHDQANIESMFTAVTLGAAAVHCRVYQAIVAQEVKKALKPVNARLDALQATVDAVAEAEGVAPEKAHKSKKHSR